MPTGFEYPSFQKAWLNFKTAHEFFQVSSPVTLPFNLELLFAAHGALFEVTTQLHMSLTDEVRSLSSSLSASRDSEIAEVQKYADDLAYATDWGFTNTLRTQYNHIVMDTLNVGRRGTKVALREIWFRVSPNTTFGAADERSIKALALEKLYEAEGDVKDVHETTQTTQTLSWTEPLAKNTTKAILLAYPAIIRVTQALANAYLPPMANASLPVAAEQFGSNVGEGASARHALSNKKTKRSDAIRTRST